MQSIVHLVSSSIEGMDSSEVTVVDGQGNLLSAAGDGTDSAVSADLASNARTTETAAYDTQTESDLQSVLDRIVGPGHAVAKVTAQLDLDDTNTTTETMVAPNPTAPPLSYSKTSETLANGSSSSATGVLGPDNIAVPTGYGDHRHRHGQQRLRQDLGDRGQPVRKDHRAAQVHAGRGDQAVRGRRRRLGGQGHQPGHPAGGADAPRPASTPRAATPSR